MKQIIKYLNKDFVAISRINAIIGIVIIIIAKWYIAILLILLMFIIPFLYMFYKLHKDLKKGKYVGKWFIDFRANAPIVEGDRVAIIKSMNNTIDEMIIKTKKP